MTRARHREVFWMVWAMIIARNNSAQFTALTELVRHWPEAQVCALAERLMPTPGFTKDYRSALIAIQRFSTSCPTPIGKRLHQVSEEIAQTTEIFCA